MSERITVRLQQAGASLALEAVLERGERGGAVIAPPHPLYGGELANPVVLALASGLERHGIATLRFNFRGVGESDGRASGNAAEADMDYAAALDHLAGMHAGPYVGAGYSFGAAAALRVAAKDARVSRLVLVAPPVALLDLAALRAFGKPALVLVGDDDAFAPLPALERALAGLSHVTLRVLGGEDHFFGGGTDELSGAIAAALADEPGQTRS